MDCVMRKNKNNIRKLIQNNHRKNHCYITNTSKITTPLIPAWKSWNLKNLFPPIV